MALDKITLKNGIKNLLIDMRTRDANADEEFATRLSNLIDDFVKSGDGLYVPASLVAGNMMVTAIGTLQIKIN